MPIFYNGQEIADLRYNGQIVSRVFYNGQEVPLDTGEDFQNIWSGEIRGLPLVYDDGSINYVDLLPQESGSYLDIVPLNVANPCVLGDGLYYDDSASLFKSHAQIDSENPDMKIIGGDFSDIWVNDLSIWSPSSGSPSLKFWMFYVNNDRSCVWADNNSWAPESTEALQFDPVSHKFSGQTKILPFASEKEVLIAATADGTGFTASLDGANYGTIYLT